MQREQQRARQALAELYQGQGAALTAYLHRLVGQRELAEELCGRYNPFTHSCAGDGDEGGPGAE